MNPHTQHTLGCLHANDWQLTRDMQHLSHIEHACVAFAELGLQLSDVACTVVGRGSQQLCAKPHFAEVFLLLWDPANDKPTHVHFPANTHVDLSLVLGPRNECTRFMQFHVVRDVRECVLEPALRDLLPPRHAADAGPPDPPAAAADNMNDTDLSSDDDVYKVAPAHAHAHLHTSELGPLAQAEKEMQEDITPYHRMGPDVWDGPHYPTYEPPGPYHAAEISQWARPELEDPGNVDMRFPGTMSKLLDALPRVPVEGEIACLRVYATGSKKTVIDRDTGLLTSQEMTSHRAEVRQSDLAELQTWIK